MSVLVSLILSACTIHEWVGLHVWNDKWRPTCETNLHFGEEKKNRVILWVFQTVLHYFDNMKSKSTPLLTIINVPGLVEHYSLMHIILKRRKKKCFVIDVACWVMHMLPHIALWYLCVGNWILNPSILTS